MKKFLDLREKMIGRCMPIADQSTNSRQTTKGVRSASVKAQSQIMIFDPSTASHLKPWLVRTLEPICDAEPGALADYILALLKHNVPEGEMRQELAVQLDEFLEKTECASFIDTLFTVLRTKSYLPYSAASPSSPSFSSKNLDNGIPIPLDGFLSPSLTQSPERNLKRNVENDERDGRAPAKGPRLSTEGQFSRYPNIQGGRGENRSTGGWGGRDQRQFSNGYKDGVDMFGVGMGAGMVMGGMMMPGMGQMNGRRSQVYQPPDQKRGICRDYHNNGYCARGATCKYSHGEDAVVPGMFPLNAAMPLPFMPMFPGAGNPFGMGNGMTAYDPHEARMDMRPMSNRNQRAPLLPRIQQEDGSQVVHSTATGELPVIQDLTPLSSDNAKIASAGQGHTDSQNTVLQNLPHQQPSASQSELYPLSYDSMQGVDGQPYMSNLPRDMDTDMKPPTNHQPTNYRPSRGGGRGRGGGGTFGGENPNFRSERRNDKTLVVEKIPEEKLTLEHVNEWFKRFGTVTNVAIDNVNAKALISFSNHDEAYAAWKSEDAVFNNRFVKLFWHRPMEGHGSLGTRMLAASAPLVANIASKETTRPATTSSKSKSITPQKSSASASTSTSALAAKQQLLEQQIAEQKSLMASLDKASPEEKKTIMARLRKLGDEMDLSTTTTHEISTSKVVNGTTDIRKRERERLDKELDMHSAAGGGEESTEDLKAKLEKLKAEAASLGISESGTEPYHSGGGYRPYRGRGRGSRGYRGSSRGGHIPRASFKLDNRPRKLLVKGAREEGVQALRDWYETVGQVESVERLDSGDVIVTFRSRAAAEQGLAKGSNVPAIGVVQATWYTGQPPTTAVPKAPPSVPSEPPDMVVMETRSPEIMHSPRPQEEEVIASGWGEDGDGEDGMGML